MTDELDPTDLLTMPAPRVSIGAPPRATPKRYHRVSALGAGGMGEVWLERDERIGRHVAIKTLRAKDATADVAGRFLREACVQGQLEHPAIVPVYDLGWADGGEPFFTMKRVEGRTLLQILSALARDDADARERFNPRRLLAAMSQVCLAVAFAHERGVVHRDIKPANIMLGEHGEVYVLDWGIAKLMDAPESSAPHVAVAHDDTPMTSAGAVVGTLSYMSPEQVGGLAVDARSDVYALGAVLFEVLSLKRFLDAGTPEQRTQQILDGVDARISVRFPGIPVAPELEDLCVRATRRDRDDRMSSARSVSEEIERFLDGVRDDEMRERRVRQHVEHIRARLETALAGDDAARTELAREAGAALALAPDNVEARRAVVALLTHPPARVPVEVEQSFLAARANDTRRYYRMSLVVAAAYTPLVLVFLTARAHGALLVAANWAIFVAVAIVAWGGLRNPRAESPRPLVLHALWTLASLPILAFSHPLICVPAFVGIGVITSVRYVSTRALRWAPLVGVAPLVIAGILAFAGIAGDPGAYSDGVLRLSVNVADRYSMLALPLAWIMSILPLLLGSGLVIAVRRQAEEAQRALHLSRWQLSKLVPADL